MISIRSGDSAIAVSATNAETDLNTAQTLDLSLIPNESDLVTLERRREDNADEMTGKEEADWIYDLGNLSNWSVNFDKAQPQHYGLLLGYGLGNVVSTAAGSGFLHTITPISELDRYRSNPSMTVAQRKGNAIVKERFYSMFVDTVTSTFAKDSFCKVTGQLKGTGKMDASVIEESVTAAGDAASLTLTNAVAGTTAAERLDAVHQIRAELSPGVWTNVAYTEVSDAAAAEITITPPGAGASVTYKVLYAPEPEAWMTFPARVSETPLRVSELTFHIGGAWNGSAFEGGIEMGAEVNSIEHKLSNNSSIEFVPGSSGAYASRHFRKGRKQTLTLDREMRNYILRNYANSGETFGASILAEGAEFDTGHKYGVQFIFPKLGLINDSASVSDKRLAEKGEMTVMQDDTYGSIIVKVKNLQSTYAAV